MVPGCASARGGKERPDWEGALVSCALRGPLECPGAAVAGGDDQLEGVRRGEGRWAATGRTGWGGHVLRAARSAKREPRDDLGGWERTGLGSALSALYEVKKALGDRGVGALGPQQSSVVSPHAHLCTHW